MLVPRSSPTRSVFLDARGLTPLAEEGDESRGAGRSTGEVADVEPPSNVEDGDFCMQYRLLMVQRARLRGVNTHFAVVPISEKERCRVPQDLCPDNMSSIIEAISSPPGSRNARRRGGGDEGRAPTESADAG